MLELPVEILLKYTTNELHKLNLLLQEGITPKDIVLLLDTYLLTKVTAYNVHDLLRVSRQYCKLLSGAIPVTWGRGNHATVEENIVSHYKKHLLSTAASCEVAGWESVEPIAENRTLEWYTNYPTTAYNFTYMERVVIHSNGRHTYISGFVGKVFIVGRYEGTTFAISSCYYVTDGEKPGRYVDKCTYD